MSVTTTTCPSCRRSVLPERSSVGLVCPRCGGFLPRAPQEAKPESSKMPWPSDDRTPERVARAAAVKSREEVALDVGGTMLLELGPSVTDAEYMAMVAAGDRVVEQLAALDAEDEQRRHSARHWRSQASPQLLRSLGVGR